MDDRLQRLHRVIRERAADPEMQDVPGGPTGLIVRTTKMVGKKEVKEYALDAALLREIRELEAQAARECGQAYDAPQVSITQNTVNVHGREIQPADLAAFYQLLEAAGLGDLVEGAGAVRADGAAEPVDPPLPAPQTEGLPAVERHDP
jgi:hypothetical protein